MPSVHLRSAKTPTTDPAAAAEELLTHFGAKIPKFLMLFASRSRDQLALNRAIRERLPKGTRLIGATTGGELDNTGYASGTALLAGLEGDFEVGIGYGRGLSVDAARAGSEAVDQAARELGTRVAELDTKEHVGIVIDDGYQMKKEELLLGILEKNQGLVVVGGGAGDTEVDPYKASSLTHIDGEVLSDGALVVLFRTRAPWAAMRSHWYEPTGDRVRITKVDESTRRIVELDGQPAALRYAALVGVPPEELTMARPDRVMANSLALRVGREYFLRAVAKNFEDNSLMSFNMLREDQELDVMRQGDIVNATKRFFVEDLPRRVPTATATILFDCAARRMVAQMQGKLDAVGDTFKLAPPCAGYTVNFEIYCGFQVNSTLTSLTFGASP
jgi:hypothetical protein